MQPTCYNTELPTTQMLSSPWPSEVTLLLRNREMGKSYLSLLLLLRSTKLALGLLSHSPSQHSVTLPETERIE